MKLKKIYQNKIPITFSLLIIILLSSCTYMKKEVKLCDIKEEQTVCYSTKNDYSYIKIIRFSKKTHIEIKKLLINNNIKENVIFDLRNNGGGNLGATREILSYFLYDKPIFIISKNNEKTLYKTIKESFIENSIKKTYTIINEKTASSAEVFTMAIENNFNNLIIGKESFGKFTIQKKEGKERTEYAKYYPASGIKIRKGIVPELQHGTPLKYILSPH